jgi:hypothetical protein
LVAHLRAYHGIFNSIDGWLLVDGFDVIEVSMEQCFSTTIRYIIYDSVPTDEEEEEE